MTNEIASFKRSFKGKRETSRILEQNLVRKIDTATAMRELINNWDNAFTSPALSLTLKNQGYPRLMWRTTQKRFQVQRYVDLYGSDDGSEVLSQLSEAINDCIRKFEYQRLALNSEMKIACATVAALSTQLNGIENVLSRRPE